MDQKKNDDGSQPAELVTPGLEHVDDIPLHYIQRHPDPYQTLEINKKKCKAYLNSPFSLELSATSMTHSLLKYNTGW